MNNINANNYFKKFIKKLQLKENNNLSKESLDFMINNIQKISDNINNICLKEKNESILLVGNVQSGKTINFLATIAKRFDNDCNLCVVVGGVTNEIYTQNLERIKEFFGLNSDDFFLKDNVIVTSSDDFETKYNDIQNFLNNDKKVIICILKNHINIDKTKKFLMSLDNIKNPLIIDDEGDQFSFADVNKINKDSIYTRTYESFKTLLDSLNDYIFLTVTATPYAHILSTKNFDSMNEKNITKPKYAFVLDPGHGYLGVSDFLEGNENVQIINALYDKDELTNVTKNFLMTESLKESIIYFIIYGHIYHFYIQDQSKISEMLVHVDVKKDVNENVKTMIENYIENDFQNNIFNTNSFEIKTIKKALEEYKNLKHENDPSLDVNNFIELFSKRKASNIVSIQTIIGKDNKKNEYGKYLYIYIGSKKIDRGNTFSNLLISYVIKRNKKIANADTLLQMCRWFGYRKQYKHLLRVWLTEELICDFISINETNNKIIEMFKEHENKPIFNLERELYIIQHQTNGTKLRGTRETVAKQEIIIPKKTSYHFDKSFSETIEQQNSNKIIKEFWDTVVEKIKKDKMKIISLKDIANDIGNYPSVLYDDFNEFKKDFRKAIRDEINNIYKYISTKELTDMNFLSQIESSMINNKRKLIISLMTKNENDTIDNMQIRMRSYNKRNNMFAVLEKGASEYYIGDKYWYKKTDEYIFIQLHKIKPYSDTNLRTGTDDGCVYKILISSKDQINFNPKNNVIAI